MHLPECADQLIEADPYGALTYGDAGSLSPSSCTGLIQALGKLSISNPWFRLQQWQSPAVGALSRPDLIGEMRAVLTDPQTGIGGRSIVIDALGMGVPRPELCPELVGILVREDVSYRERQRGLLALLRLGDAGRSAVIDAFKRSLNSSISGLRLRTEIIQRLYRDPFGACDVTAIMNEALEADGRSITGVFRPCQPNPTGGSSRNSRSYHPSAAQKYTVRPAATMGDRGVLSVDSHSNLGFRGCP